MNRPLTITAVAGLYGVSRDTVRLWLKAGLRPVKLPGYKKSRIMENTLDAWLESHEKKTKGLKLVQETFDPAVNE